MSFGVIVGGNHKWNFHNFLRPIAKAASGKRINSACLKKPIFDRVSPVKSSNQLRYTESVMQLTPDVHV